jgi:hypothetical protein
MTNGSTWQRLVQAARQEAKAARDWGRVNAIERAQRYLQNPQVARVWDETTDTLVVESPQSGATYVTNGTCERRDGTPCPAFADGRPCWHIEAKGLLRRLIDSIPPPEADGCVCPIPDRPPGEWPVQHDGINHTIDEEWALLEISGPAHPHGAAAIPLIVDSTTVAYADSPAEADQWLRRYAPLLLED